MNKLTYKLSICHLYADLLNLYGDRGNIITLQKRCLWRGINVQINSVGIGEDFDSSKYDIVFLGGGQDFEQSIILDDLITLKGEKIKDAIQRDVIFLCVCGGYQMLGKYYINSAGEKMDCLGAIDVHTVSGDKRLIGNVVCRSLELHKAGVEDILVGFENHNGRTYLGNEVKPLAIVARGYGNNGKDKTEGARYRNVYCTYMHGSFLPKNPKMADFIILKALKRKYGEDIELSEINEDFENNARKHIKSCK